MMTDSMMGHSSARSALGCDLSPRVRSYNILMYSMTGEWCGGVEWGYSYSCSGKLRYILLC